MKRKIISVLLTIAFLVAVNKFFISPEIKAVFNVGAPAGTEFQLFFGAKKTAGFNVADVEKAVMQADGSVRFSIRAPKVAKLKLEIMDNAHETNILSGYVEGRKTQQLEINDDLVFNIDVKPVYHFDAAVFIIFLILSFLFISQAVGYLARFKILENNSRIDIVFLAVFFGLLYMPMLHIDDGVVSEKEKRLLAVYQPLFKDGEINFNYGKDFEKWYNDRFFGRERLIKRWDELKYTLSGRESRSALRGEDYWLFYKGNNSVQNFRNAVLFSKEELEKIGEYLTEVHQWAKKHNKQFYYFIAPDKNKVYGEYFPDYIKKVRPDEEGRAYQLVNYLRKNTPVRVMYPLKELLERKKDGLVYWKNDTHWNEFGAYTGYQVLMDEINRSFPDLKAVKPAFDEQYVFDGDMGGMISMKKEWYQDTYYKRSALRSNCRLISTEENGAGNLFCLNPENKRNLFIMRDSFSENLEPYLNATFKKMYMKWRFTLSSKDREELADSDVIVLETVERMLPELLTLSLPMNMRD